MDSALKLDDFNNEITSPYVFLVNSEVNYDLLQDLSWLFKNNPHIDWKILQIIKNICLKQKIHTRKLSKINLLILLNVMIIF